VEKGRDRTKKFEMTKIVDTIFHHLTTFEIESFVQFWDFLNKRFFFHLDTEHMQLSAQLKSDLIKFYLINAVKSKNRDKLGEFFSMYSHEILAENGNYIPGNLRGWFVLPYMDEPEKDGEFSVYFSNRWAELLRITLQNFLSVVLSTAPAPKLLILEKWFRSEAQQEIRTQLKLSAKKIDALIDRIETYEVRLQALRDAVKSLVGYLHKVNVSGSGLGSKPTGGSLFETDEDVEGQRERARELGQILVKISSECAKRNSGLGAMTVAQRQREILGAEYNALNVNESDIIAPTASGSAAPHMSAIGASYYLSSHTPRELEDMEADLIQKLNSWVSLLSTK
jgi:hypothetical protein